MTDDNTDFILWAWVITVFVFALIGMKALDSRLEVLETAENRATEEVCR